MEMVISEITMSRLNEANVLAHFSHAGVDNMSDNTCHFGLNNFFADNYVEEGSSTGLYFPADVKPDGCDNKTNIQRSWIAICFQIDLKLQQF